MAQRESRLSKKIMTALRAEGVFCFKVHGSEHMMAGLPDIIACVEGAFVGLETKVPENSGGVTKRQEYVHEEIKKSGGVAEVVTSVEEALEVVKRVRQGRKKVGW